MLQMPSYAIGGVILLMPSLPPPRSASTVRGDVHT